MTLTNPDSPFYDLHFAITPMQFSDTAKMKLSDVKKIFKRVPADIIVGTESGEEPLRSLVQVEGKRAGFRVYLVRGHWIAIRETIMSPRGYKSWFVPVLQSTQGVGRHTDRGVALVQFFHLKSGDLITVGAGHNLTNGYGPGDPNFGLNQNYARTVGRLSKEHGSGRGLFFYMSDQNMDDAKVDTFLGEPMVSCWDELKKYPGTHGNRTIDVIARYKGDNRVKFVKAKTITDKKIHLYNDHVVSIATARVHKRSKALR